jgi:hypothetical protein
VRHEARNGDPGMGTTMSWRAALADAWTVHRARVVPSLAASLTLGLAPFYPHAHIWKQLENLANGTLTEAIDVFDLFLHGAH